MPRYTVIVSRLNQRKFPVEDMADESNVVGKVFKDFEFDGELALTNKLGDWHKDTTDNFYWGGGLEEMLRVSTPLPAIGTESQSFQWFKDLQIEQIWNQFNTLGENVTVAVLDTGYDTDNSDLPIPVATQLFVNNPTNNATIRDEVWHGTFCTSIIAARNKKINIGLAPLCKILLGKVSLKGELQSVDIILDGIEWAIQSGAEIISISLGLPIVKQQQVSQLQTRLNNIVKDKKVFIFAACGDSDSGQIISKEFYPASLDNCISVGTVKNDLIDNITVRSDKTIIHTLGVDIEGYMLNRVIEKQSGTSMSVPIIAGIMALAISLTKRRNNNQWNKDELLQKLIQTGVPISGTIGKKSIDPLKFFQSL